MIFWVESQQVKLRQSENVVELDLETEDSFALCVTKHCAFWVY